MESAGGSQGTEAESGAGPGTSTETAAPDGASPATTAVRNTADELDAEEVGDVHGLLRVVARPSRWRDVRLFASPAGASLARRPTDVVLLIGSVPTLLILSLVIGSTPTGFEAALVQLQASAPHALDPVWQMLYDALVVWAVFLVVAVAIRRRWSLVLHMLAAGALAVLLGMVIGRLAGTSWPSLSELLDSSDDAAYPALRLAMGVAVASTASPHLTRPLRYLGRWLVALGAVSSLLLGAARPWGVPAGFALGVAIAAAIHLVFGSPGGRPTLKQVRLALADLGVDAEPTGQANLRGAGVAVIDAIAADGTPLLVKVYGRDAWDGQFIASFWRLLWYRGKDVVLSLTRLQQVEHEAFLTLLTEQRGAPVTSVAVAGRSRSGDAVLAVEVAGTRLGDLEPTAIDDDLVQSLWSALRQMHAAGVAHGRIDTERVLIDPSGRPRFADLGEAVVVSDVEPILADRAQLLVTTALLAGPQQAIDDAIAALEPEGVAEVIPYLQPAALSAGLRDGVDEADLDLEAFRQQVAGAALAEIPDLRRLRRITWGSVLLAAFMFLAGYFLISSLADIGWDNIVSSLKEASLPIVLVALVIAQLPRVTQSFSVMAVSPTPLPLGRVTALEFATTFVNLAMPSTAGRVAVNIRFFQRAGATPGTAIAVGALDGFAGFICQILLFATILLFGLGTLQLNLSSGSGSVNLGTILIVVAIVAVAAVVLLVAVRRLREWIFGLARDIWATARTLRSPRAVLQLLLANLATDLLFGVAMWTVLRAFGQHVSYADVVLINEGVSLFAGLMPVPGGIGVAEAGLTAGFVAVGVPNATAFAAALTYRMISYYLPPIWGFFAFRWLQRRRYL